MEQRIPRSVRHVVRTLFNFVILVMLFLGGMGFYCVTSKLPVPTVFVKVKHFYRKIYGKLAGPRKEIVKMVFKRDFTVHITLLNTHE